MRRNCTGVVIVMDEVSGAGLSVCAKLRAAAASANVKANHIRDILASWSLPSRVLPWCRRGRRTLRRILVLIIPLNCPENLPKKALFLLVVLGTLGRRGRLHRRWGRKWLGCLLSRIRHHRRGGRMRPYSEDLLEEIALITRRHLAGLVWLSAGDKGGFIIVRAYRRSQIVRYLVELYVYHPGRRSKGLNSVLVLRQSHRPLH